MKKIIYLLVFTALIFTSCDPMEDIDNELDQQEDPIVGETTFTLSDDDYAAIDPSSKEDDYEVDKSFKTFDDAKNKISTYLGDKFPVWGKGSLANVTFNLDDIEVLDPYEVTEQDYTDAGFDYPNFGSPGDMAAFLLSKYPDAVHGNILELTYRYYNGSSTEDRVNTFVFLEEWVQPLQLSSDDYTAMGQSYPNFSNIDVAIYRMAIYFKTKYPYAEEGNNLTILYKNYIGGGVVKDRLATFTFDGTNWISTRTMETVKFGHNGTVWEPDNTIVYTLTNADYTLVGNGTYNNFDVRIGKDDETEEARIAKINTILLNNFPSTAEGQKYLVRYSVYTGAAETWETKVILQGGEYVKFEG